jgi:hypothetical protein
MAAGGAGCACSKHPLQQLPQQVAQQVLRQVPQQFHKQGCCDNCHNDRRDNCLNMSLSGAIHRMVGLA